MKTLFFKALMAPDWDIVSFWNNVEKKEYAHLGGEDGKYSISFNGPLKYGLTILEALLECEEYQITLQSLKGGDMDVKEKEETREA